MKSFFRARKCALLLSVAGIGLTFIAAEPARAALTQTNSALVKRALESFSKGKYSETLEILDQIRGDREAEALKAYWKGHCRFKLKDFELAISDFRAAIAQGMKANDLQFTLGQSLFAAQKLEEAKAAFERSAEQRYKVGASRYYVAYILQMLNKYRSAATIYSELQRMPNDPDQVKQPALFQIAEMKFEAYERDRPEKDDPKRRSEAPGLRNLENNILPLYIEARDMADDTPTHAEAKAKVEEIRNYLARSKPRSPWSARALFEFGYDSNVITQADESLITSISRKDSFVFKPTLRVNYERPINQAWSLDAGLRVAGKIHTTRDEPEVFKNDNFTFEPTATLERKNTVFSKPGNFFVTYEFNFQLQDYKMQHQFPYFSRSHNLELGQRMNPFATGQTTLKGNIKLYENATPSLNSIQPGLDLNQRFKIGKHSLSSSIAVDWLTGRTKTYDTTTIKFNNRYPIDWGQGWNITPKFNVWLIDPRHNRVVRGLEKRLNPGISLRKQQESGAIWRLSYDFTRNFSLDKQYQQYKRHEVAASFEQQF